MTEDEMVGRHHASVDMSFGKLGRWGVTERCGMLQSMGSQADMTW